MNVRETVQNLFRSLGLRVTATRTVTETVESSGERSHDAALKTSVTRWQGEIASTLSRLEADVDVRRGENHGP